MATVLTIRTISIPTTATKAQTQMVIRLETTQTLMMTMMDSTTLMMHSHSTQQKLLTPMETALATMLMRTMMVMVLRIQSITVNLLLIPTKRTPMAMA